MDRDEGTEAVEDGGVSARSSRGEVDTHFTGCDVHAAAGVEADANTDADGDGDGDDEGIMAHGIVAVSHHKRNQQPSTLSSSSSSAVAAAASTDVRRRQSNQPGSR